jgi:hypothetical protein
MAYGRAAIVTYSMQIGLVATALTIALLCLSVCRRTALFGLATALALFVLMQGTLGDNVRGHMILDRRIASHIERACMVPLGNRADQSFAVRATGMQRRRVRATSARSCSVARRRVRVRSEQYAQS